MSDPVFPAVRLIAVASLAALAAGLVAPAASAQSHAVVQPLPPQGTAQLDDALKRLAADPKDPAALIQAGDASLALHDVDAAIGFYTRAQVLGAVGGQAKAGLAAAQVRDKKPVEALGLFDEALRAGAPRTAYASDHGLAYDLVGDNAHAQEFYRLALQQKPADDETTMRLALSQAIGGDQAAADKTLLPLLQQRDVAAYRTRAFALASQGKVDEAVSIAQTMMPGTLSSRIAPYLRYMPKLTRAQQAAAANFGHFPAANAIGHDDPRIAAYAASSKSVAVANPPGDARLVPTGAPLGATTRPASRRDETRLAQAKAAQTAAVAASAPPSRADAGRPATSIAPPAGASQFVTAAPPPVPPVATPRPSFSFAQSNPAASTPAPSEAFDRGGSASRKTGAIALGDVADRPPPASTPPASSFPAAAPARAPATVRIETPPSLEQAFAEFETVKTTTGPASGAVDVIAIKPTRELAAKAEPPKPPKVVKPAKPKNPGRIWVQVATGGNRKALGRDWLRITGKAKKDFKGKSGYLVDWGRTNRLVTGPFTSEDKAQDFIADLKDAGLSTFMFTSDDGEEVAPLPGK